MHIYELLYAVVVVVALVPYYLPSLRDAAFLLYTFSIIVHFRRIKRLIFKEKECETLFILKTIKKRL